MLFLVLWTCGAVHAQEGRPISAVPLSDMERRDTLGSSGYRFIISGHFHGASNSRSGMPAATLLANIDSINATGADLMFTTGDLFLDPARDLAMHRRVFYDKLHMPVYNAVGNHDVEGGAYAAEVGPTFFALDRGGDRFIVLDTEREDSRILGAQLELLEKAAMDAEAGLLRMVFILSHRPVWAEEDPRYKAIFRESTRSLLTTNFRSDVFPLLERMAKKAPVYWASGSMGGGAPASIFWEEGAPGIHYIQSAIRDERRDALLLIDVTEGKVMPSAMSLTGSSVLPVQEYNAAFWTGKKGLSRGFNWRLLPYLVKSTVTHRNFWWGMLSMALLLFGVRWISRR